MGFIAASSTANEPAQQCKGPGPDQLEDGMSLVQTRFQGSSRLEACSRSEELLLKEVEALKLEITRLKKHGEVNHYQDDMANPDDTTSKSVALAEEKAIAANSDNRGFTTKHGDTSKRSSKSAFTTDHSDLIEVSTASVEKRAIAIDTKYNSTDAAPTTLRDDQEPMNRGLQKHKVCYDDRDQACYESVFESGRIADNAWSGVTWRTPAKGWFKYWVRRISGRWGVYAEPAVSQNCRNCAKPHIQVRVGWSHWVDAPEYNQGSEAFEVHPVREFWFRTAFDITGFRLRTPTWHHSDTSGILTICKLNI